MKSKKKIVFILIIIILVGILFIQSFNYQAQPKEFVTNRTFLTRSDILYDYEITKYSTQVGVSPVLPNQEKLTLGVVIDPWNLNFGIVPAGKNYGTRFLDLTNLKEKDAKVNFKVYGNISPFVNFTKNNFILHKNENVTVEANFYATSTEIGNYSGEIDITIQRPKYDILYNFWR